jgi:hypothetical protein
VIFELFSFNKHSFNTRRRVLPIDNVWARWLGTGWSLIYHVTGASASDTLHSNAAFLPSCTVIFESGFVNVTRPRREARRSLPAPNFGTPNPRPSSSSKSLPVPGPERDSRLA